MAKAKYLTERGERKLREIIRKVDGLTDRRPHRPPRFDPGTDFGAPAVARDPIPAATRNEVAGTDEFLPGVGTAWVLKYDDDTGKLVQRTRPDGTAIWHTVYNLTDDEFDPVGAGNLAALNGNNLTTLGGSNLTTLGSGSSSTDIIGPSTKIFFLKQDKAGKYWIDCDEVTGSNSIRMAVADSQIAAHDSGTNTPGSGTVSLWEFTNGTIADSGTNATAYNTYDYAVPSGELIVLRRDGPSNRWLVDMDGELTIEDSVSSQETLYPYQTLRFDGNTNPTVTKVSNTVIVTIDSDQAAVKLGKPDSQIAAQSGNTPGSGTVSVWEFTNGDIADSTADVTAYNVADYPAEAGELVVLRKEIASGRWIIDMDGELTIRDGDGDDETLYEYEILEIKGDRDVTIGAGNIINTEVTKAAGVVTVTLNAVGTLMTVTDNDGTPNTINLDLADDIQLETEIDESGTLTTSDFVEWRVDTLAGDQPELKLVFGRMYDVSADSGTTQEVFPSEELSIVGGTNASTSVTKLGDKVQVTVDATSGSWTARDDTGATDITINTGDTLQFTAVIDETQNAVWAEWNATAGAPDVMELSFGRMMLIQDGDSDTQPLYPTETLEIKGDGDVTPGLGQIITTEVTRAADTTTVTINAAGPMFQVEDNDATPATINIELNDVVQLETSIDESGTLTTSDFVEWRVTDPGGGEPEITLVFGRMYTVSADSGTTQEVFPSEELEIAGGTNVTTSVSKALDKTTVTIDATGGGGGSWTLRDDTGATDVTISDGDTLAFSTTIDETQNGVWAEWNAAGGAPDTMELSFGRLLVAEDGDGSTVNFYPTETLKIEGDADASSGVGEFIKVDVAKAADTTTYTVAATGPMFGLKENDTTAATVNVDAGDVIELETLIDEVGTLTTSDFVEWRVDTAAGDTPEVTLVFGRMYEVSADSGTTQEVFPSEELEIAGGTNVTTSVAKAADKTTVTINASGGGSDLPVGAIIMNYKAAILDSGKYYMDNGSGAADTNWARMDGSSNASPGSAIDMVDYFPRGRDATTIANDTAYGRAGTRAASDDDEVTVSINDHPDHYHAVDADTCDDDTGSTYYKFTVANKLTGKQVTAAGGALTLDHTVTISNPDGNDGSATDGKFEMLPPNKKLHFFEKVA